MRSAHETCDRVPNAACCAGFRIRSITPGGGLAESPLADKVTRPNILCAAVMVPRETMDVEDARPLMVGHDMTENAPRKMLSERQILGLLPIARSTLQQWEKHGNFPKAVMIGPNRKAWFADEVVAWQEKHAAKAA